VSPDPRSQGADHGVGRLEVFAPTGLPEFAPGDDLAAAISAAVPDLRTGDVLVVTSKVVSKVEGRTVPAPADPQERDELRRRLVESEAVRVVARKGPTLITENRLGVVQAASGVDGSNVAADALILLPEDPDASAAALRTRIAELTGHTVAVIITDTMGRAWRIGQTDAAIGAAGIAVTHSYAGRYDAHGNELAVTEVAIADQLAAAADLARGKLTGAPVAVVRGLDPRPDGRGARDLVRAAEHDMFRLGVDEARAEALLLRRSVREFTADPVDPDLLRAAVDDALTAPAPHGTAPVHFVWLRDPARRRALLDAMAHDWRTDLAGDGMDPARIDRRVARGRILYDAPEVLIPVCTDAGAHHYRDARRTAAEETMFTVATGAAVQALLVALAVRGIGSCWIGSTIFAPDTVRRELDLPGGHRPLGAVAIGRPAEPLTARTPRPAGDRLVER